MLRSPGRAWPPWHPASPRCEGPAAENGINLDFDDLRNQLDLLLRQTGKSELNPELKAQAEQKAREASDAAAKGVSHAAWAGVVELLLGLVVSGFGGLIGRRTAAQREALIAV